MTYDELASRYMGCHESFYRNPESAYIEPFHIFGPLYYVGDRKVCVHLIDTDEGLLLIDAGFPHTVHMLTDSIYRLGFEPKDIKMILHTHGHFDHFGASASYRRLYGCSLAISRTDGELLKSRPEISLLDWSGSVTPMAQVPEFDRLVENGEKLRMGSVTIECLPIPGHTPGAMAFFMELKETGRTLRAGLFGGAGKGSLSMAALRRFEQPLSLRQDMLDSLDAMQYQHVDIMLGNHPGNNDTLKRRERQLRGDAEAFVDPAAWPRFLAVTRSDFKQYFREDRSAV